MSPRLLQLLLCSALVRFSMSVRPTEITSTRGSRQDYIYSRFPPRLHLLADPAKITSTRGSRRDYIYSRIPPRLHLLADPTKITSTRGSRQDYIYLRIPPRHLAVGFLAEILFCSTHSCGVLKGAAIVLFQVTVLTAEIGRVLKRFGSFSSGSS